MEAEPATYRSVRNVPPDTTPIHLRLWGRASWGLRIGAVWLLTASRLARPPLYVLQVSLMLAFLVVVLLLDYVLKAEFRQTRWAVIAFVTLFFSATGGMLGVAAEAGRGWLVPAIPLYLVRGTLAFVQRAVTGL